MSRLLVPLLALTLGGTSSLLVACGDRNGLLPSSKANAMIQALNSVSDAVGSGHCGAAERGVTRAKNVLHSATSSRHTLTDRLRLELDHLGAVAATQCQPSTPAPTTSSSQATTAPTTSSTTSTTTPTTPSTQTTDTTGSSSTSTDTTSNPTDTSQTSGGATPGFNGGGHGKGNGKGNGSGGGD